MPPANLLKRWIWNGVSFVGIFFSFVNPLHASTAHQSCQVGSLCTIGEFVFTDAAVPITSATCQFTSFTPSGSSFVNSASLTGTADGWYAYSFTPDSATAIGTYPSQLCCQTTEGNLCIDKSFDITPQPDPGLSSSDISNAVWNATLSGYTQPGSIGQKVDQLQNNSLSTSDIWSYSGRTLTNFGSLLSDVVSGVWSNPDRSITKQTDATAVASSVWEYQNRSLTSFGNLVSSIWSADNRTSTDPDGATAASIAVLEREIKTAQTLINQLQTQTTTGQTDPNTPDYSALLAAKLDTTKTYLSDLSNNLEIISTRLGLLAIKWDQLSDTDRIQELEQVLSLLGTTDSTDTQTLIGQLSWFTQNWPKSSTSTLYQSATNLRTDINNFITAIQISPADSTQSTIINQLFATASSLKTDVGDISQADTAPSLYGQYKSNRLLAQALSDQLRILTNTLTDWDRLSLADRDTTIANLAKDIGLLNRFSALKALLSPPSSTPGYLHNLKAIITANQAALAATDQPIVYNWIGADATTYHTFVYNPSKSTSQTASVNYLLPSELTTENLSLTPTPLVANFVPDKNAIVVSGSPSLEPEAHQLFTLITTDIWKLNPSDIDSPRLTAASLTQALQKSPFASQATSLKHQIDTAIDTILMLEQQSTTPEAKIQSYRQIQTLKQSIDQSLTDLQNLANSQQNTSSLMGFVGGVQAVAVWGIIIIVIAGFIFLSLYMRALYQQTQIEIRGEPELSLPLSGPALPTLTPLAPPAETWAVHLPFSFNLNSLTARRFTASLILLSSILLAAMALKSSPASSPQPAAAPAGLAPLEPTTAPLPSPTTIPSPSPTPTSSPLVLISPPDLDSTINLHRLPTTNSAIITTITIEETASIATQSGDWLQVNLTSRDPAVTGWLNQNLALILPQ